MFRTAEVLIPFVGIEPLGELTDIVKTEGHPIEVIWVVNYESRKALEEQL